jgi:hypothetical protein
VRLGSRAWRAARTPVTTSTIVENKSVVLRGVSVLVLDRGELADTYRELASRLHSNVTEQFPDPSRLPRTRGEGCANAHRRGEEISFSLTYDRLGRPLLAAEAC